MQENANKNILSCVRIKNVEYPIKMLASQSDCQLTIKDLYKKTNVEEYTFEFDHIFESQQPLTECFRYVYKNCLSKAFDGINCTVVAMGVDGSGKTYSLLGDYSKQYSTVTQISRNCARPRHRRNSGPNRNCLPSEGIRPGGCQRHQADC